MQGRMMDIILVNGVNYQSYKAIPQIGQLILRNILREEFEVECINFDYLVKTRQMNYMSTLEENIEQFADYVCQYEPKVVGLYTICNSFMTSLLLAKRIKELKPQTIIALGGPHATLLAKECLYEYPFLDAISLGEGEKTILPLMKALVAHQDLSKLQGVAYVQNDQVVYNASPILLTNDELGQYTPMDYKPFELDQEEKVELEAGRGCPFECTFCSTSTFWGRKFRIKSVDTLIQEMKQLNHLYGIKTFSFVHDMFTVNKEYLLTFCTRMINEKISLYWNCSSRVDVLTPEILNKMKGANCKGIYLGIETGSPRMQKLINKNIDLQHAFRMIQYIYEAGMEMTVSFIFGYPEETIEDFQCTIHMIEEIYCMGERNVQLHRFMLLPHTKDTEKVLKNVYFDENDVDFSIYDEKLYDQRAKQLINEHPNTFISFYTFQSEVRTKYKIFDSFVFYIGSAMGVFSCCIRYLIRKYGLESLYFDYLDRIERVYMTARTMQIEHGAKADSLMPEIYEMVNFIFMRELEERYTEEFYQFYICEKELLNYSNTREKKPVYYHFPFDVILARKSGQFILKENIIRFGYENHKLRVSRVRVEV